MLPDRSSILSPGFCFEEFCVLRRCCIEIRRWATRGAHGGTPLQRLTPGGVASVTFSPRQPVSVSPRPFSVLR